MNEKEALSEAFAVCHEELERLAGERGWEKLADEPRLVELFQQETRLAEESGDGNLLWRASLDADEFTKAYRATGWELHNKAARSGHLEAIRTLAEAFYRGCAPGGKNLDAALDWALEYLRCGGDAGDFESFSLRPAHDSRIEGGKTLSWMEVVAKRAPSPECTYAMARCFRDLDCLWMRPAAHLAFDEGNMTDNALALYREAANAGFFWAQLNLGWYCLAKGGVANTRDGLGLLEKALANIPDNPEPAESAEENAAFRRELAAVIEQAFFAKTGRVSSRITDLEDRSINGDLLADIDLALAYLAGADCPRDRDKALAHASRTLFHDREFDILLDRMNDLAAEDRDWLMRNLHAEANKDKTQ